MTDFGRFLYIIFKTKNTNYKKKKKKKLIRFYKIKNY